MKKLLLILFILEVCTTGCTKKVSFGAKGEFYEIGKTSEGRIVYSSINKITYLDEHQKERNLLQDLKRNKISIDELIKKMDVLDAANDGGSVFFESNDKLAKTKFYVAYCNSLPGNGGIKDIFITEDKDQTYKLCMIDYIE